MAEPGRVYPLRRESAPRPLSRSEPLSRPPQPQERLSRPHKPQEPLPQEPLPQEPLPQEPLWREALGHRLRALRLDRQERLSETAGRAGISPQYLSEIERGRKEPSSEMIAALAGALETTLSGLTEQVAGDLRRQQNLTRSRPSGPVMLAMAA